MSRRVGQNGSVDALRDAVFGIFPGLSQRPVMLLQSSHNFMRQLLFRQIRSLRIVHLGVPPRASVAVVATWFNEFGKFLKPFFATGFIPVGFRPLHYVA